MVLVNTCVRTVGPPRLPPGFSVGGQHWTRGSTPAPTVGVAFGGANRRFRVVSMMSCPSGENQGGRHEVRTVRRRLPQMNHEVSAYPRHAGESLLRDFAAG